MKAEQTSVFPVTRTVSRVVSIALRSVSLGFSHKLMTSEDGPLLQETATGSFSFILCVKVIYELLLRSLVHSWVKKEKKQLCRVFLVI